MSEILKKFQDDAMRVWWLTGDDITHLFFDTHNTPTRPSLVDRRGMIISRRACAIRRLSVLTDDALASRIFFVLPGLHP